MFTQCKKNVRVVVKNVSCQFEIVHHVFEQCLTYIQKTVQKHVLEKCTSCI